MISFLAAFSCGLGESRLLFRFYRCLVDVFSLTLFPPHPLCSSSIPSLPFLLRTQVRPVLLLTLRQVVCCSFVTSAVGAAWEHVGMVWW